MKAKEAEKEKILHLLQLGVPKTIIAKSTGISRTTLYKYIRKLEENMPNADESQSVKTKSSMMENNNQETFSFSKEDYDNILNTNGAKK